MLGAHQSSNLVALCIQQNQIGIALLDLSAGLFKVQQQDYDLNQLMIELARLMPSEILLDENIADPTLTEQLKQQLDISVTKRPDVDFNLNNAQKPYATSLPSARFQVSGLIIYLWPKQPLQL